MSYFDEVIDVMIPIQKTDQHKSIENGEPDPIDNSSNAGTSSG